MDGVRLLGRTSGTPTPTAGPAYDCCEMKIIAFICLCCVMVVIFAIALVWYMKRKRLTEQNTLNKQTCLGCKLNNTLLYNRILVFVRGRRLEHLQEMTVLMTPLPQQRF